MNFNFFKPRRNRKISIADQLTNIFNQNPQNLHITIYIKDQVLFQIMLAKHFKNKGFKTADYSDFIVIHFFNKNKTLTFDKLEKIKNSEREKEYFFYEEPKGNFNYLKAIGQDPYEIEKEIYKCFEEIYELGDLSEVTIDYADY